MLSNDMWRSQVAVQGQSNKAMLPALLVAATSIIVVYKHFTDEQDVNSIKKFLALIVIQMLPLVFLQMKILSCPDPISMLSRFGTKALLMHACFLILRVCAWPLLEISNGFFNLLALVLVCVALHWGFEFRCASMSSHLDIGCLSLLAGAGALCTELSVPGDRLVVLAHTIFAASSYIEILAFVPGVWMMHRGVKKNDDERISEPNSAQTQAAFFFAFLVPFYIMEDLMAAYRVCGVEPLAAIGHIVHFLVVLDFACFLLAPYSQSLKSHTYNPTRNFV